MRPTVLVSAGLISGFWSGPALALSLEESRAAAAERAVEVELAAAAADAARGDHVAVRAGSLPAIVGFVDGSTGAGFTSFGFERPVASQAGVGLRGSWVVVDPSGWAASTAARRRADGQEAMLRWAGVEARRQATGRYAAALGAVEELDAWERSAEDAASAVEVVEALVLAGLVPDADLARAQAEAARAEAARVAAVGRAAERCASLQALIREKVTGKCELEPASWGDPKMSSGTHPALLAAWAAVDAAGAELGAANLGAAPSLSVNGSVAQYVVPGSDAGAGWSAGLELDVPLVAGGAVAGGRTAASARQEQARLAVEAQRLALDVASVSAAARMRSAQASLAALEESARAAGVAFELVEQRHQVGLEDMTTLLDARRSRDAAAVALAAGRAELGAALAEVEAARGVR